MHREEQQMPMSYTQIIDLGNKLEREKRLSGKPGCFNAELHFTSTDCFEVINTDTGETVETLTRDRFLRFNQSTSRERVYILSFRKEAATVYYFLKLLDKKDIDRLTSL